MTIHFTAVLPTITATATAIATATATAMAKATAMTTATANATTKVTAKATGLHSQVRCFFFMHLACQELTQVHLMFYPLTHRLEIELMLLDEL